MNIRAALNTFQGMAKTSLGRGLGELMGGAKPATLKVTVATPAQASNPFNGRGVEGLLNGSPTPETASESAAEDRNEIHPSPAGTASLPSWLKWSFWGADLLLVSAAAVLFYTNRTPTGIGLVLFCAVLVAAGAGLAVVPFVLDRRNRE